MVFSKKQRNDQEYKRYSEPEFCYLERSSRPEAILVRNLIDEWVNGYPINEQDELIARLRSQNDNELYAAFFELYIFTLMSHFGYHVDIHPTVPGNDRKTPDFLVCGHDEEFFIEATTTNEYSNADRIAEKRLNLALEKINEIMSPDFMIHITIHGLPLRDLRSAYLRDQVRNWLMTLNYNKVRELYETKDFDSIPKLEINEVNITLEITPIPKINNRGVSGRIIGSRSLEARWVNSTQAIRKSIWNKKSRYGELGKPYLLAIDVFSLSCDKEDVFDAVFGSEKYIFDWNVTTGKQSSPPKMVRGNDGSWSKSNSTKISGLLIIDDLTPWTLSQKNLSFYINPWAILPYKGKLTYLPHFLPTPDGKLEWRDGCKVREVLEIPELWPEIE